MPQDPAPTPAQSAISPPVPTPWWTRRLTFWGLLVAASAVASYFWLDRAMSNWRDSHSPLWIKRPANILTELGYAAWSMIPLGIVFIFCIITRRRRAARWSLIAFLGVAVSGLVVDVVKIIVGRARPEHLDAPTPLYGFVGWSLKSSFNSFPSGHSATIAAIATTLCLLNPRWRIAWVLLGVVVASTRVVTGSHYLSDVAVGAYLGVVCTLAARTLIARQSQLGKWSTWID